MTAEIGIGVVGLGSRGTYLGRAFDADPRARVVALCEQREERLQEARTHFAADVRCYADIKAMLADDKVEAVIVATHDAAHAGNALDVLQARKHLFLEKPMAQRIEDCDAMIQAWQESGAVFLVGLELRYCTLCQEMKAIINRGDIGEVCVAHAVDNVSVGGNYYFHGSRRKKDYIVSLILEKGTHTLDLMNWFIDANPVRVYAEGGLDVFGGEAPNDKRCRDCDEKQTCPYAIGADFTLDYGAKIKNFGDLCVYAEECNVNDNSVVSVRYDNGAKMSYIECHFTPDYSREFTLIGTKGRMIGFYNNQQEFRIELTYRHSDREEVIHPPKAPGGHGGGDPRIQNEFLERVLAGTPCCPGVKGARNSAAIAIAAAEAEESGQPVAIPSCPAVDDQ